MIHTHIFLHKWRPQLLRVLLVNSLQLSAAFRDCLSQSEWPHPRSCLLHGETFTKSLVTIGVQKPCTPAPTWNSSEGLSCHQTMPSGYSRFPMKVSVQFSHSVVSDSVTPWTAACQLPYPSPTPGVYLNSCPSNRWCHPTTSSSVIPFSSCLQYFPASGSFAMCQFFASGGQSIGASTESSITSQNLSLLVPTSIPSHPQVLIPKVFSKPLASCLCLTVSLLANLACNSILYTSLLLVS